MFLIQIFSKQFGPINVDMMFFVTLLLCISPAVSKLTGGPHFIGPAAHMTALSEHKGKCNRMY